MLLARVLEAGADARPAPGRAGRIHAPRLPERQARPGPGRSRGRPDRRLHRGRREVGVAVAVGRVLESRPRRWSTRPSTCACWSRPPSTSRKRKSTSSKNPMRAASWPASSKRWTHVFRQAAQGALLREGLNVVLVGQPNVGKSSLLNALAGADVAIVTPIAGTTRDKVTRDHPGRGHPAEHHRHGRHPRAGRGHRRGRAHRHRAHLGRGRQGRRDPAPARRQPRPDQAPTRTSSPPSRPACRCCASGTRSTCPATSRPSTQAPDATHIYLSAHDNIGIDLLRAELLRIAGWQQTGESLYLARERHLIALRAAREHLDLAGRARGAGRPVARPVRRGAAAGAGPAVQHHRRSSRRTICWG